MIFKYIIFGFIFAAGIGPVNIETAKRGLMGNQISAALFYFGNVLIDAFYLILLMYGIITFIKNPIFKLIFSICGATYLFYLGVGNIRDFRKRNLIQDDKTRESRPLASFFEGALVNLANPMAIASWTAFLSLVSKDFGRTITGFLSVMLGALFLGTTIIGFTIIFRKLVAEKAMRVITLLSGISLIGFSIMFLIQIFRQ